VLYGKICEFLVNACSADPLSMATSWTGEEQYRAISGIHASWLTTPRTDLNGKAPRDVLLAGRKHVDRDKDDRAQQWSLLQQCPPGLSPESAAYRFGGFGTHEIVQYYYLVRFLLEDCWDKASQRPGRAAGSPEALPVAEEVRRLTALCDEWLETPDYQDLHGRTPASVIARERARLPEGMTGAEAMVDHDCPMCQMMAELPGPMFWHLDGCNMDDDFAFSFHPTREEWEAERREWEEFNRRFKEQEPSRQAEKSSSPWRTSYMDPEAARTSISMKLFGLGAHLAELTQDLKDARAAPETIEALNRDFGNLRETAQDPGAALVGAVIAKMGNTLGLIAEVHPTLADKCLDLENQLATFAYLPEDKPWEDEDLPF
jgi:hypothetical protein